jgi:hypothetical protein
MRENRNAIGYGGVFGYGGIEIIIKHKSHTTFSSIYAEVYINRFFV